MVTANDSSSLVHTWRFADVQEYWDTEWENALSEAMGITRITWRIDERKLAKR